MTVRICGQLVAIKIMKALSKAATLHPRNRLRVKTEPMLALRKSESEWVWPAAHHSGIRPPGQPQNRPVWSESWAFSVKLLSQKNTFFSFILTCFDLETTLVSSEWARGLFLVCQASLMMGIKPQETEASWTGNKPQGFGGLGDFFLPPNGKILVWA